MGGLTFTRTTYTWSPNRRSISSRNWELPIPNWAAAAWIMLKRRFEILLPRTHNDGRPVGDGMFQQTLEELVVRFGGEFLFPDFDSRRMDALGKTLRGRKLAAHRRCRRQSEKRTVL